VILLRFLRDYDDLKQRPTPLSAAIHCRGPVCLECVKECKPGKVWKVNPKAAIRRVVCSVYPAVEDSHPHRRSARTKTTGGNAVKLLAEEGEGRKVGVCVCLGVCCTRELEGDLNLGLNATDLSLLPG